MPSFDSPQNLLSQFKRGLPKQRIFSYLTNASESLSLSKPYEQVEKETATFGERGIQPICNLPVPSIQDKFISLQKWEGVVIEVRKDSFLSRLHDLTEKNPEEEAEFPLEEVTDEDKKLVKPGAIFYWNIGYLDSRTGQRKRESIIRFRRLPAWRKEEIEAFKHEAKHIQDTIGWK